MAKPLLVTGAAGFVGARFVESCTRTGQPIISVDALRHFSERPEHRGIDFGKQVDRDALLDLLATEKPELAGIVHLGACTDTMQYDEAFLTRVNLEYSKSLWNYCAQRRIPLVYASSGATYGGGEKGFDDDENLLSSLKPLNPYGESKHRFDLWALGEERKGAMPSSWAGFKFFNVYGFGERHKAKMASLVIHAVDQIKAGGEVKLFESHRAGIAHGHQKRDFIYVDDVVEVLHFALKKPIARGIYNLGTGQARTFLELVQATFKALGKPEKIRFIPTPEPLRERYQYFTEAKMERLRAQGYSKRFTSVEDGVAKYVARLLKS